MARFARHSVPQSVITVSQHNAVLYEAYNMRKHGRKRHEFDSERPCIGAFDRLERRLGIHNKHHTAE